MRTDAIAFLVGVVLFGWAYWLMTWWCVHRHFTSGVSGKNGFAPPVSILKPLKGIDAQLKENLASFCRQNYGEYEILFGVRDETDPAVGVVGELRKEFPEQSIRLLVAPDLGLNPKTAILDYLARRANYSTLVISDSDIRVGPDYLKEVVAPLEDPGVGLVTCPYRSTMVGEWVSAFEAMHIDLTFIPAAVLGSRLPGIRYAFGATLVMRANDLRRCGGYAAVADALGDDYAIGSRLVDLGLRICLSSHLVDHVASDGKIGELWQREVRWARTVRTVAPLHYMGLLVPLCTLWAIGPLVISGLAAWAWGLLGATLILRWVVGWMIADELGNQALRPWLFWLPLRDALDAVVWLAGLVGRRVTWRGNTYGLKKDGTLVSPEEAWPSFGWSVARSFVKRLDAYLRRRERIFEYTNDAECIFRINVIEASGPMILRDETRISAGDHVAELHLWNEHMPAIGPSGPDMAWAAIADSRVERSLRLLARFVAEHPELIAIRAKTSFMVRNERQLRRLVHRYGFELHGQSAIRGWGGRMIRFGENLLFAALIWTFNPGDRKRGKLFRPRYILWMSRSLLLHRYAPTVDRRRRHDSAETWKTHVEINANTNFTRAEESR